MNKSILNFYSLFFLTIVFAITYMFSGVAPIRAAQLNPIDDINNSMEIVNDDSSDMTNNSKTISIPDLGDDQAFPFIPGFGKNSGKD